MNRLDVKKQLKRACPICSHSFGEVLIPVRFHLYEKHPLPRKYDIVSCEKCNFVFADTSASQDDYNNFYTLSSKYEDSVTTGGGGEKAWDRIRFSAVADYLEKFFPDKSTSFLDIGCANGGLLSQLKNRGYNNLCGVDPSEACVQNTISKYKIQSYQGTIFNVPDIGKIDVIILSHVLEHIYNIKGAIIYLSLLLVEAGYMYIEVPDAIRYKDYIISPLQDFNVEHINHFSTVSLENLNLPLDLKKIDVEAKVFEAPAAVPVPALASLWKKNSNGDAFTLLKDKDLKISINQYILKSLAALEDINKHLKFHTKKCDQFIIWGTGQLAFKLLNYTSLKHAKIVSFVDSNPVNHGKKLCGIPIISPDSIQSSAPIIISSLIHDDLIREQIKKMRLQNLIISLKKCKFG